MGWDFERSMVIYMYSELVNEVGGILLIFCTGLV